MQGAFEQPRHRIAEGLRERREEIEQALLARVYGIADPTQVGSPAYVQGFRAASSAALDFALATLEQPEDREPTVPTELLSQARLAARNGVGLDTVLRRYTAGHSLLVDFLIQEAERSGSLPAAELRRLLAAGSSRLDRLLKSVSEDYAREIDGQSTPSHERRRTERVRRLLAGELVDITELNYELEAWHVAIVFEHQAEWSGLQDIAESLDRRLLLVRQNRTAWAWFGGRRRLESVQLLERLRSMADLRAAVGEPASGVAGWRLSHQQARTAMSVAQGSSARIVRYADVALLASVLKDELLAKSLRQLYLEPLEAERDGGETARKTLRAYFATYRNASSAAALLRVSRRTITNRLRAIEERFGQPLNDAASAIELALSADELTGDRSEQLRAPGAGDMQRDP